MRILVLRVGDIGCFPPALSLTSCLLDLGHEVTLLANCIGGLPDSITSNKSFIGVELGKKDGNRNPFLRIAQAMRERKTIRSYLSSHQGKIDLVWATTDISAREAGKRIGNYKYVVQLAELVETTPIVGMGRKRIPIFTRSVKRAARSASAVVVPEYNRAHIQKVWWNLPKAPLVLPNKPYPNAGFERTDDAERIIETLSSEKRKILLYQGVFAPDRNFEAYAKAVQLLGDDYALYLMGKPFSKEDLEEVERLCSQFENVHYLGYVDAPNHLSVTPYGYIGLLPYRPTHSGRYSCLNALYCAPNKIWEYSMNGLPMLGSDVPGLSSIFRENNIGIVSDSDDPISIANGVRAIESDYEAISASSREFYNSINMKELVSRVLDNAISE